MHRKCCFEIGSDHDWCDFEFPVAVCRRGRVVGWASEHVEAAILAYAVNTRRQPGRYLPPLLDRLAGGGRCAEADPPRVQVDTSSGCGVGGCGVAITCHGRVLAWMQHRRHAWLIAAAVNGALAPERPLARAA